MNRTMEELARIAERYGVRDIYVFGSRAEEIAALVKGHVCEGGRRASDVDAAVQPAMGRTLSHRDRVLLVDELERLFEVHRVDLAVLHEAGAFLSTEVVRGELLYTTDPLAQAEHELYILRRAADLASFRRDRVRLVLTEGAR